MTYDLYSKYIFTATTHFICKEIKKKDWTNSLAEPGNKLYYWQANKKQILLKFSD